MLLISSAQGRPCPNPDNDQALTRNKRFISGGLPGLDWAPAPIFSILSSTWTKILGSWETFSELHQEPGTSVYNGTEIRSPRSRRGLPNGPTELPQELPTPVRTLQSINDTMTAHIESVAQMIQDLLAPWNPMNPTSTGTDQIRTVEPTQDSTPEAHQPITASNSFRVDINDTMTAHIKSVAQMIQDLLAPWNPMKTTTTGTDQIRTVKTTRESTPEVHQPITASNSFLVDFCIFIGIILAVVHCTVGLAVLEQICRPKRKTQRKDDNLESVSTITSLSGIETL